MEGYVMWPSQMLGRNHPTNPNEARPWGYDERNKTSMQSIPFAHAYKTEKARCINPPHHQFPSLFVGIPVTCDFLLAMIVPHPSMI